MSGAREVARLPASPTAGASEHPTGNSCPASDMLDDSGRSQLGGVVGTEKRRGRLKPDAARELCCDLKDALTSFGNGRAGVAELLHQIERTAKYVQGKPHATLWDAEEAMTWLVCRYAPGRIEDTGRHGVGFLDLYAKVREARNDVAHTGTEAALAGERSSAMTTVLMEALSVAAERDDGQTMCDAMVSNPICAHNWQTLADLRRTMLVNNYSALPISDGQRGDRAWLCVEDEELARYLRDGGRGRRTRTLGDERLKECESGMGFLEAVAVGEDEQVKSVLSASKLPVLVTRPAANNEKKREIVGIVTAFDLL